MNDSDDRDHSPDPSTVRIYLQVSTRWLAEVDRVAEELGVPRASVIKLATVDWIREHPRPAQNAG